MSDAADHANELAELVLEGQIATARVKAAGISAFECEACGNPIPESRRLAVMGCTMCTDCQTINELKNKHYRSV